MRTDPNPEKNSQSTGKKNGSSESKKNGSSENRVNPNIGESCR